MSTIITVCDTCKRPEWSEADGRPPDGETLLSLINHAAIDNPELEIRAHSCLMGCDFACNVTLQAQGKLSYVIGTFSPNAEAAEAIVDFASKYAQSETGQVPYRTWPEGIKGHFRARIIPS